MNSCSISQRGFSSANVQQNLLSILSLPLLWFSARLPNWFILGWELQSHIKLGFQIHSASAILGQKRHTRDTAGDEISILFHKGFQLLGENFNKNEINFYFLSKCSVKLLSTAGASQLIEAVLCGGVYYWIWKK